MTHLYIAQAIAFKPNNSILKARVLVGSKHGICTFRFSPVLGKFKVSGELNSVAPCTSHKELLTSALGRRVIHEMSGTKAVFGPPRGMVTNPHMHDGLWSLLKADEKASTFWDHITGAVTSTSNFKAILEQAAEITRDEKAVYRAQLMKTKEADWGAF